MAYQSKARASVCVCSSIVGNGAKLWKAAGAKGRARGANHYGGMASERARRKGIKRQKGGPEVENFARRASMFHVERSRVGSLRVDLGQSVFHVEQAAGDG